MQGEAKVAAEARRGLVAWRLGSDGGAPAAVAAARRGSGEGVLDDRCNSTTYTFKHMNS